ncbi:MAG: SDR family NAD(P)-dependent oxidoreductase [Acidobacteria bacterium]|nr:SDR family NAD(P)-dependent oxidoreductase [Acidobacteriota bacterium]
MNLLITGGAGFIGLHLVRRLLEEGCTVAVLDNFNPQVHGDNRELPNDLSDHVELYRADVRDHDALRSALAKRDALVHLAAETGTGQSMYEVSRYQDVNLGGTAAILDTVVNNARLGLGKIVVASSRAVYGEGKYRCNEHGIVYPQRRTLDHLKAGIYEPVCPTCNIECVPEATSEDSPTSPLSIYGLTKKVQEEIVFMFAQACGFSACALRYQNVFGPGQSLVNPYTGILAIFSNLARCGSSIQVFEDGRESRDFVYVDDAIEATWRAIVSESRSPETFNVGTGERTTVLEAAKGIIEHYQSSARIVITGAFRQGDIRHNFADLAKIRGSLGFAPRFTFMTGLKRFLDWAVGRSVVRSGYESSLEEMSERGLLSG